jgi:hypothetical protein
MHDPVSPVLVAPARISWDAKQRNVDLTIERPFSGVELLRRMKGWVTVDVEQATNILNKYGRLKLLDERILVIECEKEGDLKSLQAELAKEFDDQVDLEIMD